MNCWQVGFVVQAAVEKKSSQQVELVQVFAQVTEGHTGGSPTDAGVKWVSLKPLELQQTLEERGFEVSLHVVGQLMQNAGLRRRSYLRKSAMGHSEHRGQQFDKINALRARFSEAGLPILSIDTKQKELLGNFHRRGHYYDRHHRQVNDHDFRSASDGIVVPHGIYDLQRNFGYLSLGSSHDTSAFVCDNLAHFWQDDLQWHYPDAEWMLLLCDGGGSNNARHHIVKQDVWKLAQSLDINIVVAHYPPYCSKWNPIEHRFFCHVHKAWDGITFQNIQFVKERAEKTSTDTGLGIKVWINQKEYFTKRPLSQEFKENRTQIVHFDPQLPLLNYAFLNQNREFVF